MYNYINRNFLAFYRQLFSCGIRIYLHYKNQKLENQIDIDYQEFV